MSKHITKKRTADGKERTLTFRAAREAKSYGIIL